MSPFTLYLCLHGSLSDPRSQQTSPFVATYNVPSPQNLANTSGEQQVTLGQGSSCCLSLCRLSGSRHLPQCTYLRCALKAGCFFPTRFSDQVALFPQTSSNGWIASVHLRTTRSASMKLLIDQRWHLSLVYLFHAPLDLKT